MRAKPVPAPELVAIGASAGGVDALLTLLDGLLPPMRASIAIVLHLAESHPNRLVEVFRMRAGVPVAEAQPHGPVRPGHIYVAPAGYHLLVEADRSFSLSCEPPVLFSRPSIDVLFESCADSLGSRVLGMLLTGANEDGASGLARIAEHGGTTAVQDPRDAPYPTMPAAALRLVQPDYVLPLAGLRQLLHTAIR